MNKEAVKLFIRKYGALTIILFFAAAQFLLILRHKSPYLSDSRFYKHSLLELKGNSFQEAREKVLSEINLEEEDEISRNFYEREERYKNSYKFFQKRPLYPFAAFLFSLLGASDYLSLLIPVFVAYLSSIFLVFKILEIGLKKPYSYFGTALFISFYPFLDWSTYFLTDTIGFSFWLIQIFLIYKFIKSGKTKLLSFFVILLTLSLLNREQSLLMVPLLITTISLEKVYKVPQKKD